MRGFSWKIIYHFEITLGTSIFTFLCEIDTLVRWNSLTFWLFCVKLWKQVHFFLWNCERLIFKILGLDTRFYGLFYVKNEVSAVNLIYFIFYCGTVSRENWVKLVILFLFYLAQKMKLADGFMGENWHKIVKPSRSRSGKKMKLTAAVPSVSFFFPDRILDGFIILCQFHTWNHQPVSFFDAKKSENNSDIFSPVSLETVPQ